MKTLGVVLVMGICAAQVLAQVAPGVSTATYVVDRDTAVYRASQENVNVGLREALRAGKGDALGGEQVLVEWNDATVGTMTAQIADQLAANKLTMTEARDLGAIRVEYLISGAWGESAPDKRVGISTVHSVNDWVEGDGWEWDANFDWTQGAEAATWNRARGVWRWNDNGTPDPGDDFKEYDPNLSVGWQSPAAGSWPDMRFDQLDTWTENTAMFTGTLSYSSDPVTDLNFNSVVLDDAVWRDLLYNVQAEGSLFETNYNCVGLRQYGDGWGNDDNWSMFTKEMWGGAAAPRLLITVTPAPGDVVVDGEVNIIDLGILAANYKTGPGMVWTDGDLNGDGEVNIIDLGLLAANYRWRGSLAGGGGGQPVPEPCSVILTLAGVGLLAARRRKR